MDTMDKDTEQNIPTEQNVPAKKADKTAIIRILQVLEEYSDEQHPLQQQEIIKLLLQKYGFSLERKAVGDSIRLLTETFGDDERIKVRNKRKVGAWIEQRVFEDEEIDLFVDLLMTNETLDMKTRERLYAKLYRLASPSYREKRPDAQLPVPDVGVRVPVETRDYIGKIYPVIAEAIRRHRKLIIHAYSQLLGKDIRKEWTPIYVGVHQNRYAVLFHVHDTDDGFRWVQADWIRDAKVSANAAPTIPMGKFLELARNTTWEQQSVRKSDDDD